MIITLFVIGIPVGLYILFSKADKKTKAQRLLVLAILALIITAVHFERRRSKLTTMDFVRTVGQQVDALCKKTKKCPLKIEGFKCLDSLYPTGDKEQCVGEKNGYRIVYRSGDMGEVEKNGERFHAEHFTLRVKLEGYEHFEMSGGVLEPLKEYYDPETGMH